jgi:hypothetical protein
LDCNQRGASVHFIRRASLVTIQDPTKPLAEIYRLITSAAMALVAVFDAAAAIASRTFAGVEIRVGAGDDPSGPLLPGRTGCRSGYISGQCDRRDSPYRRPSRLSSCACSLNSNQELQCLISPGH